MIMKVWNSTGIQASCQKQILHDDLWNIYFTAVIWCHDWSWHLLHDMGTENKNLFGQFAWAVNIPLIIALIFTPTLVGKWKGMYKLNLRGYVLAVIGRALVVVAGYMGSVPLMMAFTALAALGQGPWQGDMNAVIASCSEYTYLTQGKRIDGTMYSCTSLGVKIGGGIGTAVVGWMLEFSGYVGTNATQPQSALDMMQFMYLWLPLIFDVLIMFVLSRMNVEDANKN